MSANAVLLDLKSERQQKFDLFSKALPDHEIIEYDSALSLEQRVRIRYAAVWAPEAGLLASLPNLEVIFSSGAGVDHVFADPTLPDLAACSVCRSRSDGPDGRMGRVAMPDAFAPTAAL